MAQPYVGEIRMFAGNFAPAGWMFCEGQLLPISENETLFQLIGTTYGGDGQSTFALPDLRGRIPIHQGNGFILAETGGAEEITLTVNQIPAHTHPMLATDGPATSQRRQRQRAGASPRRVRILRRRRADGTWRPAIGPAGGSQPHTNFQPYLCVDFIISLFGIFPSAKDADRRERPTREETMADPFVAEIRIFPFNFAPKGWAWCNGQLLPLSQNTALFSLLGTTYGGDGKSNFALPDLQGRAPMHPGQGPGLSLHDLGETGGTETVTLLESEIPSHTPCAQGPQRTPPTPNPRRQSRWRGRSPAATPTSRRRRAGRRCRLGAGAAGGDQPHNNLQPYLTFNFCIALQGVFPPRG